MMRRGCHVSLKRLCGLFGKTRHAFYEKEWQTHEDVMGHAIVFKLVREHRKRMPRIGTPKLYSLIKEPLKAHGIKLGRDKLHELLFSYGLTVKRKRRQTRTTMSRHWLKKYPNLIRELEIKGPEQVWVSDITYIRLTDGFYYLSLITDAYSRKGYGILPESRFKPPWVPVSSPDGPSAKVKARQQATSPLRSRRSILLRRLRRTATGQAHRH